jgi:hypothetical protein
MKGRLGLFLGFGAGYVIGAKAGRERYEQINRLYENLKSSPALRRAGGRARGAVGSGIGQAKDKVQDAVREHRSDDGNGHGLSVAPPPQP